MFFKPSKSILIINLYITEGVNTLYFHKMLLQIKIYWELLFIWTKHLTIAIILFQSMHVNARQSTTFRSMLSVPLLFFVKHRNTVERRKSNVRISARAEIGTFWYPISRHILPTSTSENRTFSASKGHFLYNLFSII